MAKKVYLVLTMIMVFILLNRIPHFIDGLCTRGITGVNYGILGFPTLIGLWTFYKYKKSK